MKKLAILVNIIAPYRVPIYNKLNEHFKGKVLFSSMEGNRTTWDEIPRELVCSAQSSWGIKVPYSKKKKGSLFETKFLHITPGYFYDLCAYRPDAIISNEMGFRSLVALVYGWLFRVPVWIWWGGTVHTELQIGRVKKIIRYIFSKVVKKWISYGKTSTHYLESIGVQKQKILQIQNCINEKQFKDQVASLASLPVNPVILFVGHFIRLKGVEQLIHAVSRLQKDGEVFSLLLVGDGPEKENLISSIRINKLKNVEILHPQKPADMPAVYRSADILVFPTLKDVWGLVVNEALWSGLPVLSSIYAGCTQEIVPKANWFDPLNEQDFVDVLKRAVKGDISPADTIPLKTYDEVSQIIIDDLKRAVIRE